MTKHAAKYIVAPCAGLLAACGPHLPAVMPVPENEQRSVVQQVVRAEHRTMRSCYEAGLQRNVDLAGRIEVRFVIEANGKVSEAAEIHDLPPSPHRDTATPRFPDAEVVRCVVGVYRKLTFPPLPKHHITVVYPVVFDSK